MEHQSRPPVAVVGAGIVGISAAIHLQRLGVSSVLVDREGPGAGASQGNGGVLACCAVVPVGTPGLLTRVPGMLFGADGPLFVKWGYTPFMVPYMLDYLGNTSAKKVAHIAGSLRPLLHDAVDQHANLAKGTGAARYLNPSKYLYLYPDRAAYEADAYAWNLRRDNGYRWDVVEGETVREIEPAVSSQYGCAVVLDNHGVISDPGAYVTALADSYQENGGQFVRAQVRNITDTGDGVALETDGDTIEADKVIVACGAWSGTLAAAAGVSVRLESERGYHFEVLAPNVSPKLPLMDAKRKFVASPMDGRVRFAGIVEFGGLEAPASKGPLALLERGAKQMFPDLEINETRTWLGHRPATADSIPVIGESPNSKRVLMAYGHHHVGLTAGPKTGLLVAQMAAGHPPNIDLSAYSTGR